MLTPFQTAGPYLELGLRAGVEAPDPGQGGTIEVRGRLLDGAGAGIPDGVVECWHPQLRAISRALTSGDGTFVFTTTPPPRVPGPDGSMQAPHLAIRVLGRGILTQYLTRMYFPDDAANDSDPILRLVPPDRRQTLLATRLGDHQYHFDIVIQGNRETVFFDL